MMSLPPGAAPLFAAVVIGTVACWPVSQARSETCSLQADHAGLTFPIDKVDADWTCRLQPVVDDYTTANKIGPVRTALTETLYTYLLDRPPTAAALINRLDLGLYKSEIRGPGLYWGDDGEGTQGLVHLVYHDRSSRIYYLEGTHHSRLLPSLTGKAVVLLRTKVVREPEGTESMDTTMVSYMKVDNRFVSGVLSLLRPLIGSTVEKKLAKGLDTVNRLGVEMRRHPDRVLSEAMDPPALDAADVAFLQRALADPAQVPGRPHDGMVP
ncbi:conserved protein of unknown function [Nitrospira japonica]|uniref:Uncharacterized protein n=1 Tax=Nitrospira japonica TaxID=1325564 RepID=A0A1W1IAE7_9BACT|nr:hypothetical protein [Nitrospira japonica]SLM50028.1 conserved protein of unknown function [Nitrospira japonica]